MDRRELGAGTRVVRAARSLPPGRGEPVVPPLVQSVAFDYGSAAEQLLQVHDVAALARLARDNGSSLAVDANFATPVLFRPAVLGATMVIHSLTKYVNGHGDVMGGSVGGGEELGRAMRDRTILDGAYLPPHEAWLAIRGMRTLALRMRRQCDSALGVARHLAKHPKVARVRYPGLPDHPQHEIATLQFGG